MGEGEAEAGEIALPRKYSLGRVRRIPAGSIITSNNRNLSSPFHPPLTFYPSPFLSDSHFHCASSSNSGLLYPRILRPFSCGLSRSRTSAPSQAAPQLRSGCTLLLTAAMEPSLSANGKGGIVSCTMSFAGTIRCTYRTTGEGSKCTCINRCTDHRRCIRYTATLYTDRLKQRYLSGNLVQISCIFLATSALPSNHLSDELGTGTRQC